MPAINIANLCFSFSAQPLLDNVSLSVSEGERAALVGPNGCGKSTLLRLARGELTPDRGSITVSGTPSAGAVSFPPIRGAKGSVQDYLDTVLAGPRALLARFDQVNRQLADGPLTAGLDEEYDRLLAALSAADVWSLESRTGEVLAGLGLGQFAEGGGQRSLATLSPGQVGRLELAGIILVRPAVLILDEPTNHLDDDAVAYLSQQVTDWPGPVLMASHDRDFIERTATVVYDLDIAPWQALAKADGAQDLAGVYRCAGAYSDYLAAKQKARAQHRKLHTTQQDEKRHVRGHRRRSDDIALGGVKLATAQGKTRKFYSDRAEKTALRHTRNDDQRLADLAAREVRKPRYHQLKPDLPQVTPGAGLAITARSAAVLGRLTPTTFDLARGEHLLLTGPNGAGKTTLLNWIATGHAPRGAGVKDAGSITVSGRVAYVPQRLPRQDDPYFKPEHWREGIGQLGAGLLHPAMWSTPVDQLSEGNQRRAQIALATAQAPQILIIDEPTNYLDLNAVEELEEALHRWNGTLVIASHDQWLINHWPGKHRHLNPAP